MSVSRLTTASLLMLLLLLPSSANGSNPLDKPRREVIKAYGSVVATDDRRCSDVGIEVLQDGGNAVDAAVAAALCLGVVSPASSGIGGGAFMLVRSANGTTQAFDMRETAPSSASPNMYAENATLKASGPLSIAVPGELVGLHKAWKQKGRLPWRRLVSPAELLARRGFRISPYLHMQMTRTESGIKADEGLRSIFTSSNGSLLQAGAICRNQKLADTLREISERGLQPLYNGSIGLNLVRDVQKLGGILTFEDLQNYEAKAREPITASVGGLKILGMPPPSSGGAGVILMLNILSQYKKPLGVPTPLWTHREIESLKHVFALRMRLGDPDYVNVSQVVSDMLSIEFAAELRKSISDSMTFNSSHYGGRWNQINDHGTSHMSIVDHERNAVSMTTTINSYFGAQILSPSTGIVLNNEMDDFSAPGNSSGSPPPAPNNFVRPGKRPLSSMSPTIILKDEQIKGVVGASGGAFIIGGTAEVFLNHFSRGMDPFSSVMAPRVYHQLIPNTVSFENWTSVTGDHFEVPAKTREALRKKGHVLQSLSLGSICQFVVQDLRTPKRAAGNIILGELTAVSDPRKGGAPAGV